MKRYFPKSALAVFCLAVAPATTFAQNSYLDNGCSGLPTYAALKAALTQAVSDETSGLDMQMWGTIVDRDGIVCAVAFSGDNRSSQWPGSRIISAQKANTANSFSLDGLALSTANLYSATQPGGSLFGLQESNPVDTAAAYKGPSYNYGTTNDPLAGSKIGGVNVFGGGLALYTTGNKVIGAVGVSGDTSCADHRIAWRVRNLLKLDNLTGVKGVSGDTTRPDNIVFDITAPTGGGPATSTGGYGQPSCGDAPGSLTDLPVVH